MACFEHATVIDLAARETLALPDVQGTTLRVTRGTVWITQENDTQDIVLRAGDSWVVERDGLTIAEARGAATLCAVGRVPAAWVVPGPGARRPVAAPWRALRSALAGFLATPRRQPLPYY